MGRSRDAHCFRIVKILLHPTRNLLRSANPVFESIIDSQSQDSSLDTWTTHEFLLVLLDLFLRNKLFSILRCLGNILLDFLGRVCSSIPILRTSLFHLFEPEQPIDSPVGAVIVWIQTPSDKLITLFGKS